MPGLQLHQINWKCDNQMVILGIVGKTKLFGGYRQIILLRKEDGNFVLYAPSKRKERYPLYLYDIMDIENFVKRYPVQVLSNVQERKDMEELFDELEVIKEQQARGFIETQKNLPSLVYEIK